MLDIDRLQPLEDRILVRRADPETATAAGIVIPDIAQEKQLRGTVLAVGPGRYDADGRRVDVDVTPGDEILFQRWGGVPFEGENVLILERVEVLAVVG